MIKQKITALVAVLALSSAALVGCASSPPAEKPDASKAPSNVSKELVDVRVATNNAVGQLSVVIGIQEGIFEKHGLKVAQTVIPNITLIPAAVGKTFDFGYSVGPIAISAVHSGLPLVAVTGLEIQDEQNTPTHLLGAKNIKKVTDLKGKTIGAATLNGTLHLATLAMLRANGVNPADVKAVQMNTPVMLDQLRAGKVDAVELQVPYLGVGIAEGFTDLGEMVGPAMGLPTVMTYYVADKAWAQQNKDTVINFRKALDETNKWILDNPKVATAAIAKATGLSDELVKDIPLGQFKTALTAADIEKWGKLMKQEAGFTGEVNYSEMVLDY